MKNITLVFLFCIVSVVRTSAQTINVQGSWDATIPASAMITEAGLDYNANLEIESAPNQVLMDLVHRRLRAWHVNVNCEHNLPDGISLTVRRKGNGNTTVGTIYGGDVELVLTNLPQRFIYGTWDYTDIPIQYRLFGNISVLFPAKTYEFIVTYTILDNWY